MMTTLEDGISVIRTRFRPSEKGIKYFEQAIKEAPSDPLGYAGLANCYVLL